jgi:virulence factor Mce-like protein
MRRALASLVLLAAVAAVIVVGTGASGGTSSDPTYKIEFDNAFGLVTGADFKVAGVPAGSITGLSLDQKTLNAVVTVHVTNIGLSQFHTSATCESEPQSLIGEYFVSCDPGTTGPLLKTGATIPVAQTSSTIPADLLLDVLQVPERERLPLIIDSLGAGVAARSGDLQSALDRAVPALRETDNLLALLADDSGTLKQLTGNADQVLTALANNSGSVQRFIQYADNTASDTATQQANLKKTLADLPGFLAQLKPSMAQLGEATDANLPVLTNLHTYSGDLDTLFTQLPGFSKSSIPAIKALGKASVTGKQAVIAAKTTVSQLNAFSTHAPELAKNLSIVLPDLNTQKNATETNARSPGGKGYSGLEALLQFVFNLSGAINYYGPTGHMLAVDGFVSAMCTPYATPQTIADNLKTYGAAYRQCYSWLGPNQPAVNETDPSNPSACVADPGGAPPGKKGPSTSACALDAASSSTLRTPAKTSTTAGTGTGTTSAPTTSTTPIASTPNLGSAVTGATQGITKTLTSVGSTITSVLNVLGGHTSTTSGSSTSSGSDHSVLGLRRSDHKHRKTKHSNKAATHASSSSSSSSSSGTGTGTTANQAMSLLKYLLSS